MRDIEKMGTPEFPLRASGLQKLVECPWRAASMFLFAPEEESGPAGDTGSATHAAVAAFHKSGGDEVRGLEEMRGRRGEYPLADLDDAGRMFLEYASDPRNAGADVLLVEQKIEFEIPPAEDDQTKAPIVVVGRLDQVRRKFNRRTMWDLKTSTKAGHVILAETEFQGAAYCLGASQFLGAPVEPGGVICPRRYKGDGSSEPVGVFFEFTWSLKDALGILNGVRHTVARLRRGEFHHLPGDHCNWCHYRTPDVCRPLMLETKR